MRQVKLLSGRRLVKICGNRFPGDAFMVAACEPDFMGWIFSPRSPRRVPVELAARLIPAIRREHPHIRHVAVLADNSVPDILRLLLNGPRFDFLQVVDGAGFVAALERALVRFPPFRNDDGQPVSPSILPVLRVRAPLRDSDLTARYGQRALWLMDSYVPGVPGGTGQRLAPEFVSELRRPFLLAGGLGPENVREALERSGARGADVSSGIELPGRPGRKDRQRLRDFVAAVRGCFGCASGHNPSN